MQNAQVPRIYSSSALQIAGLDRLRFNEAVNSGSYPCAPPGQRGKQRLFSEDDVVCLYVYANLLRENGSLGMTVATAGALACRLMGYLLEYQSQNGKRYDEDQVVLVVGQLRSFFVAGSEFDYKGKRDGKVYQSCGKVLFWFVFDIGNVRTLVREAIEEIAQRVGDPDSDD